MKICTVRIFLGFLFFFLLFIEANAEDSWNLQGCIDYAVQNNPDLQAAEAKIKVSAYSLDFQKKLFFPRLDLNASTGYLNGEPTSSFAVIRGITEEEIRSSNVSGQYVSAALALSVPVLKEGVLFAKNAPTINMATQQVSIDKNAYEARKNEIIFSISTSFFNLLKNNEDIKTAEEHMKSLKLDYEIAISKFKEELISKNELLIAGVRLASGEKELLTYRNLSQQLIADLAIKMGLDPIKPITISEEDFTLPDLPSLDKLVNTALTNRPEIMAQETRVSMAKEDQRRAENQKYPNVDLISTYTLANDYGSRSNSLWSSTLQLNLPIFDFGAIKSQIESQKAKVSEEDKLRLSIKGNIVQEVITTFTNINNARFEISLKEKMIEQSMENARLLRSRFEQNLISLSSVLEAEYTVYANQKALAQAKYDLRTGYLQLVKATGSGLILLAK